jgi:hypothetical protein
MGARVVVGRGEEGGVAQVGIVLRAEDRIVGAWAGYLAAAGVTV